MTHRIDDQHLGQVISGDVARLGAVRAGQQAQPAQLLRDECLLLWVRCQAHPAQRTPVRRARHIESAGALAQTHASRHPGQAFAPHRWQRPGRAPSVLDAWRQAHTHAGKVACAHAGARQAAGISGARCREAPSLALQWRHTASKEPAGQGKHRVKRGMRQRVPGQGLDIHSGFKGGAQGEGQGEALGVQAGDEHAPRAPHKRLPPQGSTCAPSWSRSAFGRLLPARLWWRVCSLRRL